MELGTYSDLTSFIGEAFPYYPTWQYFTFLFWVGFLFSAKVLTVRIAQNNKRYIEEEQN